MKNTILYISFDVVPAPKGAATHIRHFVCALAEAYENVTLVTVSPREDIEEGESFDRAIKHLRLPALGPDLIARVAHFRRLLINFLIGKYFDVIHFRSPFEGYWLAAEKARFCRFMVFEVNGLPSIELKYRYPMVADDTVLLNKLLAQEQTCLDKADLIITPSSVTASFLRSRQVGPDRLRVIANGVDLTTFTCQESREMKEDEPLELLYFGTLSAWQGVEQAVRTLALINRDREARLTIVGGGRPKQMHTLRELAQELGVAAKVSWPGPLLQEQLAANMHKSHIILAPLTANDRNITQGCCPLKVLEGMASGTPVLTSDLAVTRELGADCLFFAKAGSSKSLKDIVLAMSTDQNLCRIKAKQARARVESHYTWELAGQKLLAAYGEMLAKDAISSVS
jgi:glycosyltransferase involved in cell wall biosynthesis